MRKLKYMRTCWVRMVLPITARITVQIHKMYARVRRAKDMRSVTAFVASARTPKSMRYVLQGMLRVERSSSWTITTSAMPANENVKCLK